MDLHTDDEEELHGWTTLSEALEEIKDMRKISGPTAITSLLSYSRALICIFSLDYFGKLELTGGFLSISIADMTGYSVISKFAMGTEPICGQAYGTRKWKLFSLTLQRTVLLLLFTSILISFVWLNMKRILLRCGQEVAISSMANIFIVFSIPVFQISSFFHSFTHFYAVPYLYTTVIK